MTAICTENTFPIDLVVGAKAPTAKAVRHPSPLADARRMARRMLECARPNHESMLGYALVCSEWRMYGFHKCTGPLFDEVNALRAVWWDDGRASPRGVRALESVATVLHATSST